MPPLYGPGTAPAPCVLRSTTGPSPTFGTHRALGRVERAVAGYGFFFDLQPQVSHIGLPRRHQPPVAYLVDGGTGTVRSPSLPPRNPPAREGS